MTTYVGIDLGTTNSAICSYDGEATRTWKSPEQNDVTPSAIYIDRRGNRYVGKRAYDAAAYKPGNTAMLFKRHMGTNTPIEFPAVGITMSPEECSAEVLRTLFGYLPEEIRNNENTGTVITVPAAFNQMQKDATRQAAETAGIGQVALMQEPVAAIMAVMRADGSDGLFLVYDLGGGTLDIAIAEAYGGRVNLLAHGGIAMCGGRDFDRDIVRHVVGPWLRKNFELPEDLRADKRYARLARLVEWATEKAKIELSAREEAVVSLTEDEIRLEDLAGDEIYLEVPLDRDTVNRLIRDRIMDSVRAARETIERSGVSTEDLSRIVFVGGPTAYKPLRDMVTEALGVPASLDVNPMTAVAEGAAVFAESIDWSSVERRRKSSRGQISVSGPLALNFKYISRTPDARAKIVAEIRGNVLPGSTFQVDSVDTGWSSGKLPLQDGAEVVVPLARQGENSFKIFVFDPQGGAIQLGEDRITISRTAATIDGIPASHSIGVEVLDRLGGKPVLEWLVRAGDPLPKKSRKVFRAGEPLKAGSTGSLNFRLWEGEIEDPVTDNRPIGVLKIAGTDFDEGVIPTGAELICENEIMDSGNIVLNVSVPCIGGTFGSGRNFYSRQEGQVDFRKAAAIVEEESEHTLRRIDEMSEAIGNDPDLEEARQRVARAREVARRGGTPEEAQEALESVYEARKRLARLRRERLAEMRRADLNRFREFYETAIKELARPSERTAFENLLRTAERAIESGNRDFEHHLEELHRRSYEVLWRQDWFIVQQFRVLASSAHRATDPVPFMELVRLGEQYLAAGDVNQLRGIVPQLAQLVVRGGGGEDLLDPANIVRA